MKQKKIRLTIENKIVVLVLSICLLSVLCLGFLLIYNGYQSKMSKEQENGEAMVRYLTSDINTLFPVADPDMILDVCRKLDDTGLYVFDADGRPLLGSRSFAELDPGNIVAESTDNALSWHICYVIDPAEVQSALIEEQKYVIIATIALLIITVQVGIFVAYNISEPIRTLSETCAEISAHPDRPAGQMADLARRSDEIGQLADSFSRMLHNLSEYNAALARQKSLNESIIENLPTGILAFAKTGEMLCASAKATAMLDNPDYTAGGRTLGQIVQHLLAHEQVLHDPIRLTGADGRVRDYEIGVWQLSGAEPDWGTLCTIDDITYDKMMEEKVSETEKLAYTGKVAAMLAHEIRNPLAGIRASIQVISRRLSTERDQLLCTSMVHEVDRVNLLIEDLLNLARKRESHKALIEIRPLFDEISMLYSKIAENKGITMETAVEGAPCVLSDESELKQALVNFINNSIKALSTGGNIWMTAKAQSGQVVLTVTDNGPGMSPDRLNEVRRTAAGGGVQGSYGLAISTRLLAANAGSYTIDSQQGAGTAVTVQFAVPGTRTGG